MFGGISSHPTAHLPHTDDRENAARVNSAAAFAHASGLVDLCDISVAQGIQWRLSWVTQEVCGSSRAPESSENAPHLRRLPWARGLTWQRHGGDAIVLDNTQKTKEGPEATGLPGRPPRSPREGRGCGRLQSPALAFLALAREPPVSHPRPRSCPQHNPPGCRERTTGISLRPAVEGGGPRLVLIWGVPPHRPKSLCRDRAQRHLQLGFRPKVMEWSARWDGGA
jgi:hypothetical protein